MAYEGWGRSLFCSHVHRTSSPEFSSTGSAPVCSRGTGQNRFCALMIARPVLPTTDAKYVWCWEGRTSSLYQMADKGGVGPAFLLSQSQGWLICAPMQNGQLHCDTRVRLSASSPTLMKLKPGPVLQPATSSKGQGREDVFSPLPSVKYTR